MKCMSCGTDIEEGILYCQNCGKEVQIVPDYSPLDEVLAAQVKGAINGGTFTLPMDMISNNSKEADDSDRMRSRRNVRAPERRTGNQSAVKKQKDMAKDNSRKKQQAERRKQLKKQKRNRLLLAMAGALILLVIVCFFVYQNSYTGYVKRGYKEFAAGQYESASQYFEKAISKKKTKPEGYSGLAKVYAAQDEADKAELLFLDTLELYPSNLNIYEAAIAYYIDAKQEYKVSELLADCEDSGVLKALKEYKSPVPEFSLKEDTYDDVQEVSLTSKGTAIYYTIDGSEPSTSATEYTEAIQLGEGTTVIRAISVNKKGIPSLELKKEYIIELPIEDAPAVSPSTGQYAQEMKIEIQVPSGCVAYYTLDGSTPTKTSNKYIGPIDMPVGNNTLFSAILINSKGKTSGITKRNYDLTINE